MTLSPRENLGVCPVCLTREQSPALWDNTVAVFSAKPVSAKRSCDLVPGSLLLPALLFTEGSLAGCNC